MNVKLSKEKHALVEAFMEQIRGHMRSLAQHMTIKELQELLKEDEDE